MQRNVVLVVLDSVRKDFFDRYATRLRERADASFERARAPSGWSSPSHASMISGELPHRHGVDTYSRSFESLPPERTFFPSLPHAAVGVSANVFAGSAYGFDRYFDAFLDVSPVRRHPEGLDPTSVEYDGPVPGGRYLATLARIARHDHPFESAKNGMGYLLEELGSRLPVRKPVDDSGAAVLRAARSLVAETPEPWVLFVNLMDAHEPLRSFRGLDPDLSDVGPRWSSEEYSLWELMEHDHPDYWEKRESLYGAYVDYLDRIAAEFATDLAAATDRETTVVVTADHGENHGEPAADGLVNHKSSLAEPLLHVPLEVLNAPGGAEAPDDLVSLLDLPELLVAIARDEWADVGRETLVAEVMGTSPGPAPPPEVDESFYRRGIRACIRGDSKYVWDSTGAAVEYELDQSRPSWQSAVGDATVPDWALDHFETPLVDAVEAARANDTGDDVDGSVDARLRDLGYL